jgi:uncharacterized protein YuzE
MAEPTITVDIDTEIGAAYVKLGDAKIVRTVEHTDDIMVDLDELGMVVGIEILDLSVPVPLDELVAQHHIKSTTLARLLAGIRPVPRNTAVMSSGSQSATTSYRALSTSARQGESVIAPG